MTPDAAPGPRWEDLFDELAELAPPSRARHLAELEGEDPALASRLARLLAADVETAGFLARPAVELLDDATGGESASEPSLPAGTRVGSWRLCELLGRGGMGEVYLAQRDEGTFTQQAALKLIKRGMDSRAIVRRFMRERRILAQLDHPGIARLLDGGGAPDGRPFFVLERVEGMPITRHCRDRACTLEERLRLVLGVCSAVDSAHRRLVVHRDLKPANILVTADGTVKLLDFGIAKLLGGDDEDETAPLTQLDAPVLTPAYAAPEQILGEPITTATDVYALGVLLFELITGTLPHGRERRAPGALAQETVERPSAVLRRLPGEESLRLARRAAGDLDLIVLTALHRDPARRYSSAAALGDDVERFLAGRPIRARPDTRRYRLRKFAGRNRLPVAAAALGLVALLAGLGLALWQADAARLAARRADVETQRAERVKSFLLSVFRQSDPEGTGGRAVSARELLEGGARRIDSELAGEPATQADVFDAVARIESNLGLLSPALAHAQRALALREAVLPRGDARIAESRVLLGNTQRDHGDAAQARQTLETALAETVAARGAGSLEVAEARRSLATGLHRPEDRARAADLLRQALATIRRSLGDSHLETAETLLEFGRTLEEGQQYGEAERAYRQALARLKRVLGARHPKVAMAQADLAGLLDRLSRPAEARDLFEQAIATQRAFLGPRHPQLADTLFSYGVLLVGRQELPAADAALREALSIYGPDRYEAAYCLRYLGVSAINQERYQDAAGLFTRAAETFERTRGASDAERWRAIANLGWAHMELNQLDLARRELTEAVAQIERLAGPESYEIRLPLKKLGETLTRAGATTEAIATLERVRRLEVKLFGTARHREVAGSDLLLAKARIARRADGDRREARHLLDEALTILSTLPPRDFIYGGVLLESGRFALAEGDRTRARRELAAAEPLLLTRLKPDHAKIRELRRLLQRAGWEPASGLSSRSSGSASGSGSGAVVATISPRRGRRLALRVLSRAPRGAALSRSVVGVRQRWPTEGSRCPTEGQRCPDRGQRCPLFGNGCLSGVRQRRSGLRFERTADRAVSLPGDEPAVAPPQPPPHRRGAARPRHAHARPRHADARPRQKSGSGGPGNRRDAPRWSRR
jgi:tRNA A-37 threonylcarbamoyl transferase component Bud32/TolA-binding protein